MMDFLVQVAASNQLSPATHTFQVLSPDTGRVIDYYASQAVGSLGQCACTCSSVSSKVSARRPRSSVTVAQTRIIYKDVL